MKIRVECRTNAEFDACIKAGNIAVIFGLRVVARENSSVVAWENSSVEARWNSSVEARENSSVVARENSSVEAWENSSVVAWGNSSVEAWGNSSVEARGNSFVRLFSALKIKASAYVAVMIHGQARELTGGRQIQALDPETATAAEKAEFYGPVSPEEVMRLDEIRKIVLAKPKRLQMRGWHSGEWTPEHTPEEEHECGSAHCMAGFAQALCDDPAIRKMDPESAGRKLLPTTHAMGKFFVSDKEAFEWLEKREYAPASVA